MESLPGDAAKVVANLAQAVEPWRTLYSGNNVVSTAVLFVHLSALLASGGLAIAADRSLIQSRKVDDENRAWRLSQLAFTHRPVVIALMVSFVSGLLLLLADVQTFVVMRLFWIKMALILLLMTNALFMMRHERRLRAVVLAERAVAPANNDITARWSRLRKHAWASLSLWFAIVLAGTAMTSA